MVLDKRLPAPSRNDHHDFKPQTAVGGASPVDAARPLTLAQERKMQSGQLAAISNTEIFVLIGAALVSLPLLFLVHSILNRVCFRHVKRYCIANNIEIAGWRTSPEFDNRGTKTENTQIEVYTFSDRQEKRVLRFIVWAFGIRSVSEHPFDPEDAENEDKG